jgi:hypothetical protein
MKAAWNAYVDAQMPIVKAENPGFKRSQLMQLLIKSVHNQLMPC